MVNRPPIVLHLSFSVWVNVSKNCRPCLPSQCFIIATFSLCGMLYDLNTLFTSNLKCLRSLYLSSASQLNMGYFTTGSPILGLTFCVPPCLVLFTALGTAMVCTATLVASAAACTSASAIFVCSFASSVFVYLCFYIL